MTILELVIVIAILVIVTVVTLFSFSSLAKHYALETETDTVQSFLERAKEKTISSDTQFGVHLSTSSVELFEGSSYLEENVVTVHTISPRVYISEINIAGGDDVVFERLVGTTDNFGNIVLSKAGDETSSSTINIFGTGLSEVR